MCAPQRPEPSSRQPLFVYRHRHDDNPEIMHISHVQVPRCAAHQVIKSTLYGAEDGNEG